MPYQKKWKPGKDFDWIVEPYILQLPQTTWSGPLRIKYPPETYNRVTWQWYSWMNAHCKGDYTLKLEQDSNEGVIIAISKRLGKAEILTNEPAIVETDTEVADIMAKFAEMKGKDNDTSKD